MRIFRYIVEHDKGFAPNPFQKVCTLACCKPQIRETAAVGDVLIGFGSKQIGLEGRLIYWMAVEEILTFDGYWADPRFRRKRPQMGGSLMLCYGDNLYHRDPATQAWIQEHSFHTDREGAGSGNLERDTSRTDRVLIGWDFTYWGGAGPEFPGHLSHLAPEGRPYRCNLPDKDRDECLRWLSTITERGYRNDPADWAKDHPTSGRSEDARSSSEKVPIC